jgi:hypothetical protein
MRDQRIELNSTVCDYIVLSLVVSPFFSFFDEHAMDVVIWDQESHIVTVDNSVSDGTPTFHSSPSCPPLGVHNRASIRSSKHPHSIQFNFNFYGEIPADEESRLYDDLIFAGHVSSRPLSRSLVTCLSGSLARPSIV